MKSARSRKPLTQDDVFKIKFINEAAISPDGRTIAFVLSQTVRVSGKQPRERQTTSIWLTDTEGGEPRRLTNGKGNDSNPVFSANGSHLYFLSTRDKSAQIYSISLAGGEAQAITDLAVGAGQFKLSPDGKQIAFVATMRKPDRDDAPKHNRINRPWYRFDPAAGYLQDIGQAIHVLQPGSGKARQVTKANGIINSIEWSPDGRAIAFVETGLEHHEFVESDLHVVNLQGELQTLIRKQILTLAFWTPDGKQLGILKSPNSLANQNQLTLVNRTGGKPRSRTAGLDRMVGGAVQISSPARTQQTFQVTADGKHVYAPISIGGELQVFKISLTGRESCTPITHGAQVCHLLAANHNQLVMTIQDLNTPPELHVVDTQQGLRKQITRLNDALNARVRWPVAEHIEVKSSPNVTIEGWVLKPRHVRAPYKTLLCIHGGPHAGFGNSFNCDYHELAGAGYAIVTCNPRGSTGYGDEFSTSILGSWGHPETRDFNAVLDHLIKDGIAHKDRLGVTGVSGGGHLSGWLIGQTNRFKAAVPEQGVYNMLSMWGTSDAGKALIELEMGGPPHKISDTYWSLSPLAHAHKCRTPTLLIQGEQDIRCPMEQAEQMYAALEHHGCTVELLRLDECSHGAQVGGKPELRRFRMDAIKAWFKTYI